MIWLLACPDGLCADLASGSEDPNGRDTISAREPGASKRCRQTEEERAVQDRYARKWKRVGLVAVSAVVVATAIFSAGTSGAKPTTQTVAQMYAAAKKEGSVTWYTSAPTFQVDATISAFKKQYPGIDVNVARDGSGPLETRYEQERSSGASTADVMTNPVDPKFNALVAKKGWMETSLSNLPAVEQYPKKWVANGGVTVGLLQLIVAYNKNLVQASHIKTWKDVLRPEFEGQIIFGDPRAGTVFLDLAQLWRDDYGPAFLRKFAAQQPQLVTSIVPAAGTLAAGGAKLVVPGSFIAFEPDVQKGAPMGLVPISPTIVSPYVSTISTDSPRIDAADLFVNFLMTKPGQVAFNSGGGTSPLGKLPGTNPLPKKYVKDVTITAKAQKDEQSTLKLLGIS